MRPAIWRSVWDIIILLRISRFSRFSLRIYEVF